MPILCSSWCLAVSYKTILYAAQEGILTLTLHRPDKMNAFTRVMMYELIDAFDRSDADDDVRVVVVTGSGRAFCAGADLARGGDTFNAETNPERPAGLNRDGGGRTSLRIFDSKKPVIAAINGAAVGVGVTMILPMDIRLASEDARFGLVFTRRGIVPEACSSWFLPRVVGINQALEWIYSGRVFPAQEALAGGLVKALYPPDELMPAAYAIAREIADNTSAISVALSRQMLWRMLGADHPMEAHKIDSRGIYYMGQSADVKEGIASFLEKRPAVFPGKVSQDMPEFFPWWDERTFE